VQHDVGGQQTSLDIMQTARDCHMTGNYSELESEDDKYGIRRVRGRCLRALVAVPGFRAAVLHNTIEFVTETGNDLSVRLLSRIGMLTQECRQVGLESLA
jgi:hypothetical protein